MINNCTVLSVGDELLIGQVINTNAAWISEYLIQFGIHTVEHISVADTEKAIHDGLSRGLSNSQLIVMTGGLGPTKDDITKVALCSYFNLELEFNEHLFERIKEAFRVRNIPIRESHRIQCYLPKGIRLLKNELGTAPGMLFTQVNKYIISLPGVPYEMKNILENGARYLFEEFGASKPYYQKTLMTSGMGETSIAEIIDPIINYLPAYFKIAYLPSYGSVRVRLSSLDKAPNSVTEEGEKIINSMLDLLGDLVYGVDDIPLSQALGDLLQSKSLFMATAESCTGGHIGHQLTSIPGSSQYYVGGIIAYSNELKKSQLNVSPKTLEKHGAVSEETVREMLEGLLENTNAQVGISVSGIAGPGGGTEEKPVGTIWIAYGNKEAILRKKIFINRNRKVNIQYASHVAINLLRKFILTHY